MARLAVIAREKRKIKLTVKYSGKYQGLKTLIRDLQKDPAANYDALQEAYKKFRALPRNASPMRVRRRCRLTGRSRGVYRKVGLCRNKFREYAMRGEIPGLVKSSW